MARTEFYDDPDAPEPNSLVVAASAVVTDEQGCILLQRRADSGLWALPGGGMEVTESLSGAAVREVKEETGLEVEIVGLVGTYTAFAARLAYSDGEVRRQFNVCFTAHLIGGALAVSDQSTEVRLSHVRTWPVSRCTTPSASASTTTCRDGAVRISGDQFPHSAVPW